MAGDFLPIQMIYKGTTQRCVPSNIDFPKDWDISYSANHWSNESTMIAYVYVFKKRKKLCLNPKYPALVIFDYFKGQCMHAKYLQNTIEDNNIFYILVPPNCLQPLDLSGSQR